jgi:hypothetical protein
VAVNVTPVPAHILLVLALIVRDGADDGLTVKVTLLEVAVVGEAQAKFEVITQLTISPLCSAEDVNTGLFEPAAVPFTFHW